MDNNRCKSESHVGNDTMQCELSEGHEDQHKFAPSIYESAADVLDNQPAPAMSPEDKLRADRAVVEALAPQPQPNAEKFCINDPELKLAIPMRDATDKQLAFHLDIAQKQHQHFMQVAMQNMQNATNLAQACAALAYEQDRRSRAFTIITELPANIRDIRPRR